MQFLSYLAKPTLWECFLKDDNRELKLGNMNSGAAIPRANSRFTISQLFAAWLRSP